MVVQEGRPSTTEKNAEVPNGDAETDSDPEPDSTGGSTPLVSVVGVLLVYDGQEALEDDDFEVDCPAGKWWVAAGAAMGTPAWLFPPPRP